MLRRYAGLGPSRVRTGFLWLVKISPSSHSVCYFYKRVGHIGILASFVIFVSTFRLSWAYRQVYNLIPGTRHEHYYSQAACSAENKFSCDVQFIFLAANSIAWRTLCVRTSSNNAVFGIYFKDCSRKLLVWVSPIIRYFRTERNA